MGVGAAVGERARTPPVSARFLSGSGAENAQLPESDGAGGSHVQGVHAVLHGDAHGVVALRYGAPHGIELVMPPRRNRLARRPYDHRVCRQRHLAGNAFGKIKRWRGLVTSYCKRTASFEAAVRICCIAPRLHILRRHCLDK